MCRVPGPTLGTRVFLDSGKTQLQGEKAFIMLQLLIGWSRRKLDAVKQRLHALSETVAVAESLLIQELSQDTQMKLDRLLISGTEVARVTGTQDEIAAAASRMARRTRSCVTVAVVVAHYHRRNCEVHPRGGFIEEGN